MWGISWLAERLSPSQEGLCSCYIYIKTCLCLLLHFVNCFKLVSKPFTALSAEMGHEISLWTKPLFQTVESLDCNYRKHTLLCIETSWRTNYLHSYTESHEMYAWTSDAFTRILPLWMGREFPVWESDLWPFCMDGKYPSWGSPFGPPLWSCGSCTSLVFKRSQFLSQLLLLV
jgi:hypothetical protein